MTHRHGERRYDPIRERWQEWDDVMDGWWDLPEPISKALPKPKIRHDPFVYELLNKYLERSEAGIKKYGTTLARKDVDLEGWLVHIQEELMDGSLYVTRALHELRMQKDDLK